MGLLLNIVRLVGGLLSAGVLGLILIVGVWRFRWCLNLQIRLIAGVRVV